MNSYFEYDRNYSPVAPAAEIEIMGSKERPSVKIHALIDSGADATMIPTRHLREVRARKGRKVWLRGVTQHRIPIEQYWIWLRIGKFSPVQLQVVSDPVGEEAILGRDVLNQFIVTLNGLASTVEISN
jgi:hypothetical protein